MVFVPATRVYRSSVLVVFYTQTQRCVDGAAMLVLANTLVLLYTQSNIKVDERV